MEEEKNMEQAMPELPRTQVTDMLDEKARRRQMIGYYSRMLFFVFIGMALVFCGMLGYKWHQKQKIENIIEVCIDYGEGTDTFYCCAGCGAKGITKFTYMQPTDTCMCGDQILWKGR